MSTPITTRVLAADAAAIAEAARILAAGGLGEFAAGNRGKLLRTENGRDEEIPLKLVDLVTKGDMRQNLPLKAGDVIVVPPSRF